jgi:hypothetical protein
LKSQSLKKKPTENCVTKQRISKRRRAKEIVKPRFRQIKIYVKEGENFWKKGERKKGRGMSRK